MGYTLNMPFGAIYGALFFAILAIWMIFSSSGPGGGTLGTAKLFLAPAALVLALALLMRMQWSRWAALFLAAIVAWYELRVSMMQESVASYLWLFGAVVALLLLALPATGDLWRGRGEGDARMPRIGRLLGLLVGCCLAGMLGTLLWHGSVTESAALAVAPAPERVVWSDFGRGLEKSAAEGRPLMVAFVTAWCGYCRQMDRVTWKDPDVIDELEKMVPVRVDAEESVERHGYRGAELAGRYAVATYPTMLLLDSSGRELSRAVGYKSPGEFLRWLRAR